MVNIKTKEMNYAQFIEKLAQLQKDGAIDMSARYKLMSIGQELSQTSFERGLNEGMDIYKR